MTAGVYNITIEQGADLAITATLGDFGGNPVDLTGWAAQLMIRQAYTDPSPVVSLSNGSGITLGGTQGTILIDFPGTLTAALSPLTGLYDLKLTDPSGVPYRLLEGTVTVVGAITR